MAGKKAVSRKAHADGPGSLSKTSTAVAFKAKTVGKTVKSEKTKERPAPKIAAKKAKADRLRGPSKRLKAPAKRHPKDAWDTLRLFVETYSKL